VAYAGNHALVKVSGAPVAFVTEACASTDYQVYYVSSTDINKEPWGSTATMIVYVDGSTSTETYTLDRLAGSVSFAVAATSRGAVTLSGDYVPLSSAANAHAWTISVSANNLDDSVFGDSWRTRIQGLKDVSGSLSEWYSDNTFVDILTSTSQQPCVIEMFHASTDTYFARAWAVLNTDDVSAAVDGLVEGAVSWSGTLDADDRAITFG